MGSTFRIGLDLDGVIIDHRAHKCRWAREMGFELEPWQLNSNLIRGQMPDELRHQMQRAVYGELSRQAPPFAGALEWLPRLPGELYLVSARRAENVRHAQDWLDRHRLYDLMPAERVVFCPSGADKRAHCERLGLDFFLDDELQVLNRLAGLPLRRVFFDPDAIASWLNPGEGIGVVPDWAAFAELIRKAAETRD